MVGSSLGTAIGCLIGNIVAPGIGGFLGSIIGGFIGGFATSMAVDYLMDGSGYSMKVYERRELSEDEKVNSYNLACIKLDVSPRATKETIKATARRRYLEFHPDKAMPQDLDYNTKRFIEIRSSYTLIKQFRTDAGTW